MTIVSAQVGGFVVQVARAVHYYPHELAVRERKPHAAIVTEILDEKGTVGLAVLPPATNAYRATASYSDVPTPFHWTWAKNT